MDIPFVKPLIDREELEFEITDKTVDTEFSIQNTNNQYLLFKILITAPKRYTIRPTKGIIYPSSTISVTVYCNIHKNPKLDKDKVDKLQIRCGPFCGIPPGDIDNEASEEYFNGFWQKLHNSNILKHVISIKYVKPVITSDVENKRDINDSLDPDINLESELETLREKYRVLLKENKILSEKNDYYKSIIQGEKLDRLTDEEIDNILKKMNKEKKKTYNMCHLFGQT